jgi:hypothetical protein
MERNGVPETLIRLGYIYPVLSLRIISGVVCGNMAGSRSPSWARPEECTEYVGRALSVLHSLHIVLLRSICLNIT